MASSLISRRLISKRCDNRIFLDFKRWLSTRQTIVSDVPQYPPLAANSGSSSSSGSSKGPAWKIFKTAIAGVAGVTATAAGYATYAYTMDEASEKARKLRSLADQTVGDDASFVEKYKSLAYNFATKVSAKTIELYIDLRMEAKRRVRNMLLPELHPAEQHLPTLVLDLNETLVSSDWHYTRGYWVLKRHGVDTFLEQMGKFYEIVVYSDEFSEYVSPVVERLDRSHVIRYRLSRSDTKYVDDKYYRDLSRLNRDPRKIVYVSGHALENCLQRENCVPIKAYDEHKRDDTDTTLVDLIPFLEYVARKSQGEGDVRTILPSYQGKHIPEELSA